MDLFAQGRQAQIEKESPLANRMRPRTLEEFAGQEHIVGPGRLLRRAIQADQLSSLIFYGPPGTGKTTLARVIANSTRSHFITINAVLAGVAQIREAIAEAQERRNLYGQRTTLFVDEVHRWNKAQQDALLPHVENGTIILIGATTENPYFEVNKALVSRSRIFQLKPLTSDDLRRIALQALHDAERGYGRLPIDLHPDALDHLVDVANGDARGVLNALELAAETTPPNEDGVVVIDLAVAEESIQRRAVLYDKEGDVHYDTISAFIKSLRGSDPDAALYWLAKMIYAGEDPRFIFRRMAILAGEDVGLADPNAAVVVASCWELFERIGLPEGQFPLAQAALYLATCPKSNSALAFFDALGAVEQEQESEVPNHLKDANRDKEGFGHGQGYLYPHAYREHWVAQQYLPDALQGKVFYQPGDQGYERQIREQVARRREEQLAAMLESREWRAGSGEVLTTGPVDKARDAWLQRTISQAGRNLGHLRDRLFALALVQRHHLVLDLNAGSGLLTWEAVRRAPEGGVWAITADPQAGEALRQQAARLPELERPVILIGELAELEYLLSLRGEADLRFDRILGRNVLTANGNRTAGLAQLAPRLLPAGRLCLAQVIPRHNQRLYELVDWSTVSTRLAAKVKAAEEEIYRDPADPLVNWDEANLAAEVAAAGFSNVQLQVEKQVEQRRITAAHLERWFGLAEGQERGSHDQVAKNPKSKIQNLKLEGERLNYVERLQAAGLRPKELEQVAALYRRQLHDQVVGWPTTVAFLIAGPPAL
ncbi:MAG: AAA family ATPase [Chloroflexi bacterium]|nr:AAA family ATPase [Chloroflexota bacterium]MCI0580086.1 AAA family ATPase [Chloroflexota bacterium]MCI0649338.1 AAA family ATPase [Chloroflexota bacterium]MCI0726034.1 AAA family ATPase [Chloroflexota bacterium]